MRHLVDPSDCHLLFECLPTISGTENILCNNIHFSVINIIYLHFNLAAQPGTNSANPGFLTMTISE